jgi:hypothetical protein
MSGKENLRKRSFVDAAVQGRLVLRILLYWAVFMFGIAVVVIIWRLLTYPSRGFNTNCDGMWFPYGPAVLAALLLLPAAILDIVRFSHRFVGPILRLRRCMRQLARGEHVEPIRFRRGDFWQDLADEFNAVAARLQDSAARSDKAAVETEELVTVS